MASNLHEVDFFDDGNDFVEDSFVDFSQSNTQDSSKLDDIDDDLREPIDAELLFSSNVAYNFK